MIKQVNRKTLAIFGLGIFVVASIGFVITMQMATAGSFFAIKGHTTVSESNDHPSSDLEHDVCQPAYNAGGMEFQEPGELHFNDDNGNDIHDHGDGIEPAESTFCLVVGEI